VCPTLLAPGLEEVTPRRVQTPAALELATTLAASLQHGGVLVVLDLEPILGVRIAALLNQWRLANGVLLLPRWPYRHAILPVDGLVQALVEEARRLSPAQRLPNVAFVLDAERTRQVGSRAMRAQQTDNRYRLAAADLPNLAALRANDIRAVRKVSRT
jgi:hypothetical protein